MKRETGVFEKRFCLIDEFLFAQVVTIAPLFFHVRETEQDVGTEPHGFEREFEEMRTTFAPAECVAQSFIDAAFNREADNVLDSRGGKLAHFERNLHHARIRIDDHPRMFFNRDHYPHVMIEIEE